MVDWAIAAAQSSVYSFNSWYATQKLMLLIEDMGKTYYCPPKKSRFVDDTGGLGKYKAVAQLIWNETETKQGKVIKIKRFPGAKKVKLFRVVVSIDKTEFIATNDKNQDSTDAVQQVCDVRWKIAEFHQEIKQLNGMGFRAFERVTGVHHTTVIYWVKQLEDAPDSSEIPQVGE